MLLPPIPNARVVRFDESVATLLADALDELARQLDHARSVHEVHMARARHDWRGTTARWIDPQARRLSLDLIAHASRCRASADDARRSVDVASALQARYNDEHRQRAAIAAAQALVHAQATDW